MSDLLKELEVTATSRRYDQYTRDICARAKAEIERLRGEISDWESHWNSYETELKDEIKRLRRVVDAVKAHINNRPKGFNDLMAALRELEDSDGE
jgi:chromosome segregation ATPase